MIKKNLSKKIASSILVIIPLMINYSCKSEAKSEEPDKKDVKQTASVALTVSSYKVTSKTLNQNLIVTGSVSTWDTVSVQSAANGLRVLQVLADSGDFVQKGQLLVKLDDSLLNAQMLSAKARIQSAEAQLLKAKAPNRIQDIERQKAVIQQLEANLENAKVNSKRFEALFAKGAASKADLDLRKTTLETAEAQINQEKQRLDLLVEGSRIEDIRVSEAAVAEAKAQIAQINVQLAQTKIYAPTSGLIADRMVHLGDVASSAAKMFSIIRDNRYELYAKVPENDLRLIKAGDKVEVSSDADPNLKTTGTVRQIGPGVDPVSRQAIVKISLVNVKGLQTGQFLKGKISFGNDDKLVIPSKAVVNLDGKEKVFVLSKDAMVKAQMVKTGFRDGDFIEIVDGLKADDEIVSDGAGFLRDGDKVKVVAATSPAQPAK